MQPSETAIPVADPPPTELRCSRCDYNLKCLDPASNCPECGQPILQTLTLGLDHANRAWLRRLQAFGAAVCAQLGVTAERSPDHTGVYVAGRKVGSIGVAVRRWVNLHGIALNVAMDLAPFFAVRPCGLPPATMTDLSRAAGRPIAMAEAIAAARQAISELGER